MSSQDPDPPNEQKITHWQEALILGYVTATFGAVLFLWLRFGVLAAIASYVVFTTAVLIANKYIWEPWQAGRRARRAMSVPPRLASNHSERRRRRIPVLSAVYDFLASPAPKWLDRLLQTSCQSNGAFLLISLTTLIVLIRSAVR